MHFPRSAVKQGKRRHQATVSKLPDHKQPEQPAAHHRHDRGLVLLSYLRLSWVELSLVNESHHSKKQTDRRNYLDAKGYCLDTKYLDTKEYCLDVKYLDVECLGVKYLDTKGYCLDVKHINVSWYDDDGEGVEKQLSFCFHWYKHCPLKKWKWKTRLTLLKLSIYLMCLKRACGL